MVVWLYVDDVSLGTINWVEFKNSKLFGVEDVEEDCDRQ